MVPTDGSEYTRAAISKGLELAKLMGADVTALYVVDQTSFINFPMDSTVVSVYSLLEKEGKDAVEYVKSEGEKLGRQGQYLDRGRRTGPQDRGGVGDPRPGGHGHAGKDRILQVVAGLGGRAGHPLRQVPRARGEAGRGGGTMTTVGEVMTSNPIVAQVPGSRNEVLKIMVKHNLTGLPVVRRSDGSLAGIITRQDIFDKPDEDQAALIMNREPVTIGPRAEVEEAAKILLHQNLRHLPVIDGDKLVGILTPTDLLSVVEKKNISTPVEKVIRSACIPIYHGAPLAVASVTLKVSKASALGRARRQRPSDRHPDRPGHLQQELR